MPLPLGGALLAGEKTYWTQRKKSLRLNSMEYGLREH